jgi:hypothetical protein
MDGAIVRWVAGCAVSVAVGFGGGVFATRTLYGDPSGDAVRPERERPVECPPCPPCPRCPPPPRCEDGRLAPAEPEGAPSREMGAEAEAGATDFEAASGRSGVSMDAIAAAESAVLERVETCRTYGSGGAVLELTVTVTGTTGTVREAFATRARFDDPEAERCLEAAARAARFPATGPEGQSVLKIPVRLE